MIKDRETARELVAAAFDASNRLDSSIEKIVQTASPEDLQAYKRAVGTMMAELYERIFVPIFDKHPDLMPEKWREWYKPGPGKNDT